MPYRVGVSTGLYRAAGSEELSDVLRKLGAGLTMGTAVIELAQDYPHEILISDGLKIRDMAKKQGVTLTSHGSLTVPIGIPERGEWRDADDHLKKSIRSAVFAGAVYVNFHASLREWLELMTYAGRKLTMIFCDHEGNFISKVLQESENLRKWFVEKRWQDYYRSVLTEDEYHEAVSGADLEIEDRTRRRIEDEAQKLRRGEITPEQFEERRHDISRDESRRRAGILTGNIKTAMLKKFAGGERWDTEEIRGMISVIDGYHIMFHHLFYKKDKMLEAMAEMYPEIERRIDYGDFYWPDKAWEEAEKKNDRRFKEFFYAAVAAKYLEGHTKKAIEWMDTDLIKEIKALKLEREGDREKLLSAARNMKLCFESPDARDPSVAGLYLLWSPRQIYAAIKTARKVLKTTRPMMLMDFEHVATQGIDPILDMEEVIKIAPDYGEYVLSVHCNPPNPLHSMQPIELGDIRVYQLLWFLRQTGFGKKRPGYLIFERGAAKDPYAKSVETLKLCAEYLDKETHPDELPAEFFGMKGLVAGDIVRQRQIIKDHFYEPIKDLLEMPEEEWGALSQALVRAGKKPELWKKGELR
ncbi:MAG: hypothetical protein KAU24_04255 [Candidatus Aenigmarchaeota archaeon]|nr:hypothetical protein [Candidatus Aenigmarchaeota archaeon]